MIIGDFGNYPFNSFNVFAGCIDLLFEQGTISNVELFSQLQTRIVVGRYK